MIKCDKIAFVASQLWVKTKTCLRKTFESNVHLKPLEDLEHKQSSLMCLRSGLSSMFSPTNQYDNRYYKPSIGIKHKY